jgi:hypothetical protein
MNKIVFPKRNGPWQSRTNSLSPSKNKVCFLCFAIGKLVFRADQIFFHILYSCSKCCILIVWYANNGSLVLTPYCGGIWSYNTLVIHLLTREQARVVFDQLYYTCQKVGWNIQCFIFCIFKTDSSNTHPRVPTSALVLCPQSTPPKALY